MLLFKIFYFLLLQSVVTVPETNIALKMDDWKTTFLLGKAHSQVLSSSFREGICLAYSCCHCLVHMLAKCKNVDPFHARIWFSPGSTGGGCHS